MFILQIRRGEVLRGRGNGALGKIITPIYSLVPSLLDLDMLAVFTYNHGVSQGRKEQFAANQEIQL